MIVNGGTNVGGLIGYVYANNKDLTIDTSSATGTVQGTANVGGLIGYYYSYEDYQGASKTCTSVVKRSYATGNVTGTGNNIGGLVGYQQTSIYTNYQYENLYSYIQECYATGKVSSTGNNVGGLAGYMQTYNKTTAGYVQNGYTIIQNTFASGEVSGNANVGALIGNAYRQNAINDGNQNAYLQIINNYAVGKVIATGEAGGLVGQLASTYYGSTTTTNSYWTPETTMQNASKTGTMKNIQPMLYSSGYTSWDFSNIWKIEEGTTLAYLKNISKPDQVNKENLQYQAFDILGGGTAQDPYIIKTVTQLQEMKDNLEAYYKLGANIDLTGVNWAVIGNANYPFKGTLDGNGYTISNLNINQDANNIGLFGYNSGTIKNIKIDNFNIKGKTNVGGLVGYNDGTISYCTMTNSSIEGTENYAGGLVGYSEGVISNCTTQGTITGINYVGGLVRMRIWKCNSKFFSNGSKWNKLCWRISRRNICT